MIHHLNLLAHAFIIINTVLVKSIREKGVKEKELFKIEIFHKRKAISRSIDFSAITIKNTHVCGVHCVVDYHYNNISFLFGRQFLYVERKFSLYYSHTTAARV